MNNKSHKYLDKCLMTLILVGIFLLISLPLFVSNDLYYPYIGLKGFSIRFLIEIIFILWILLFFRRSVSAPYFSPPILTLMVFIGFMTIANSLGLDPVKSHWGNLERMEGLTVIIHFLLLTLVLVSVLKEKKYWFYLVHFSFLIALIVGGIDVGNFFIMPNYLLTSTLGNSGYLGIYMAFHLFISGYLYDKARLQKTKWANFYLVLVFIFLMFLAMSGSRGTQLGALIGALFTLSIVGFKNKNFKKYFLGILFFSLLAISALWGFRESSFIKGSSFLSRMLRAPQAFENRVRIWSIAFEGIKERPLVGWGQENFSYIYDRHYTTNMGDQEPWFDRSHNVYLDWFLAGGFFGGLLYIAIFASLLHYIWKKQKNDLAEKAFLTGLLICYLIHNFFIFDNLVGYLYIFLIISYISQNENLEFEYSIPKQVGIGLISMGLLSYLLYACFFVNLPAFKTSRLIVQSLKEVEAGYPNESIALMKMAINEKSIGTEEATNEFSKILYELKDSDKNNYEIIKENAEKEPIQLKNLVFYASYLRAVNNPNTEEVLKEILRKFPNRQLAYYEAIKYYSGIGDNLKAFSIAKSMYELDPKIVSSVRTYALLAILRKEIALSDKLLSQILVSDYAFEKNFLKAYLAVDEKGKAIDFLKKRANLTPDDPDNYTQIGMILEQLGKNSEARVYFQKAQEITQKNLLH